MAATVLGLTLASPAAAQTADPMEQGRPVTALNKETPSWFSIGAAYRFRFEDRLGSGFKDGNDDGYGLNRILLDLEFKPSSRLKFHFTGQDARAPGYKNAPGLFRDPFDVRGAWVEVGDPEKDWATARVGRQDLLYGAQRLLGPLDWTNTARQFDAAKVRLGKKDLNIDFFAASVVNIDPSGFNKRRDGNNLHGAYSNLSRLAGKGVLEAYTLWKTTTLVVDGLGRAGDADVYTSGVRWLRPLAGGFDVEMEMAKQYGTFGGDDVSAWGGYWILGYKPAGVPLSPKFSLEYQYGSGDSDSTDGKRGTFDQLYPTGHLYQGTADRIGWQNVSDVRAGVATQVHKKLGVSFDYFSFWLADRNDHMYAVNGSIAVKTPASGVTSSHVGQELDGILTWKPATHVTIGAGLGYFFTGQYLKETTPGDRHVFTYLFLNYVL